MLSKILKMCFAILLVGMFNVSFAQDIDIGDPSVDDPDESNNTPSEEITVTGSTSGGSGTGFGSSYMGWMASYWEFAVFDDVDFFNVGSAWVDILGEVMVDVQELAAAEQAACEVKIEDWRQDCHSAMNTARNTCLMTNVFVIGATVRNLVPAFLRGTGTTLSAYTAASGCANLNMRAHASCDAIADSDRAPDVALCD